MTELHLFVAIFEREDHKVSIEHAGNNYYVMVEDLHNRPTRFVFDKDGNFRYFTIDP